MKNYTVHLVAFRRNKSIDSEIPTTQIHIPNDSVGNDIEEILEKIYQYGQNDFRFYQPCEIQTRSISVGDVIELNDKKYLVGNYGFIEDQEFKDELKDLLDFDTRWKLAHDKVPFLIKNFPKLAATCPQFDLKSV